MGRNDARAGLQMRDIAQALADSAEELAVVSDTLNSTTSEEYLVQELSVMVGVRVKLAYNIKKLKQLTGQVNPAEKDRPF